MTGDDIIEGVANKIRRLNGEYPTDREIASYLGITVTALGNWRDRRRVTVRQLVGLIHKSRNIAVEKTEQQAIRPIVEFFKLRRARSRQDTRYEIFNVRENEQDHPYLRGLRDELEKHHGIYMFYDSRGRALYGGKARQQRLWSEINNAYNRDREVQLIRRVNHPERRVEFRTSDEKRRRIVQRSVALYDLAAYVSAYRVADGMIGELESLIIRGFANDLLNVRMENFSWDS